MTNSRDYKSFQNGGYYHIYNRGNNKDAIFLDNKDYSAFLNRIKMVLGLPNVQNLSRIKIKSLPENSISILSFCLMPNHFHFLIKQNFSNSITNFMAKLCNSYAKYFNLKYQRIGNVWQDIFKAKPVTTDDYLLHLVKYIICNPENYQGYPYSSLYELLHPNEQMITDAKQLLTLCDLSWEQLTKFLCKNNKAVDQNELFNFLFD